MSDPQDEQPARAGGRPGEELQETASAPCPSTEPPSTQAVEVIHPFNAGYWFPIPNAVFDVIMPRLSSAAFKVLCVIIRQTWGWVADSDGDGRKRKRWDTISYSQLLAKTGLRSYESVARALRECLGSGYIIRRQAGRHKGTGKPLYAYALNVDLESRISTATETVVETTKEAVVLTFTDIFFAHFWSLAI